ncbi:MAG: protein translocase subunit SecD [Candidatus Gribaldobacteria bacterium]|nr:protein translocase subunit SecD [Candidatus Gribaldobacteria bacterium]
MEFDEEGAKIFEELTDRNVGKTLAIFIDGVPISTTRVNEKISGGRAQISGNFSDQEVRDLVRNLNAGALPVPIKLISQNTVGPTLGLASMQKSLLAALYGFVFVVIFMVIVYRFSGLLASVALLTYVGIMLSLFKLIPVTLSLAGIGGAILSVGMAVDANVLIFARMKEERKKGENFQQALEAGFNRAWPSIRDSNVTTILIAVIMFLFGTSFVKGFAFTLAVGVLVSMFSALFTTKTLMKLFSSTKQEKIKWLW